MDRRSVLTRVLTPFVLAAVIIGVTPAPASADHGSIYGVVTDTRGRALAKVCVQVGPRVDAPCWTYTDRYGKYTVDLSGASDGMSWQLRFSKSRYEPLLTEPFQVDGATSKDATLNALAKAGRFKK